MRCCDCDADVGDPDIGDPHQGGTPVAIGCVVCRSCLEERNRRDRARLEAEEAEDARNQFTINFGGTTVLCDDRDDTPAHLE